MGETGSLIVYDISESEVILALLMGIYCSIFVLRWRVFGRTVFLGGALFFE